MSLRVADAVSLLRHAKMSTSYKPALLLAIARCVNGGRISANNILLNDLASEYLKMYWSQVVVFRLRHSPRDLAPPEVVQEILGAAAHVRSRRLGDLSEASRDSLTASVARILTVNVLSAFHASKPDSMPRLFEWRKGSKNISLSTHTVDFIKENFVALSIVGNYFVARYVSKLNAAPHLVEKIEKGLPARKPLTTYYRQLMALGERTCFYCGVVLAQRPEIAVDHFLPWAFVFEDKLWNMVLTCQKCNTTKSDRIPSEADLKRLIDLNKLRCSSPVFKSSSQLQLESVGSELERLYKLAREEQWPLWHMARRNASDPIE